jgi:hypothetical protein
VITGWASPEQSSYGLSEPTLCYAKDWGTRCLVGPRKADGGKDGPPAVTELHKSVKEVEHASISNGVYTTKEVLFSK